MTSNEIETSRLGKTDGEISIKELVLNIKYIILYLKSRWLTIAAISLLGGVVGLVLSLVNKPVYIARSTFVLEDNNGGGGMLGQYAGVASMVGIDMGAGSAGLFQGDNIIELYKSRNMIKKTLLTNIDFKDKKETLLDHFLNFQQPNGPKQHVEIGLNDKLNRVQDSIINGVVQHISNNCLVVGKPDKKLGIIEVKMQSTDELFSKEFNEKLMQNVNEFYIQTKTKRSIENIAILQYQTDSVREALYSALNRTATITDATPNLNPTKQILRVPAQRTQFNAETNKAVLTQLVQSLELAKISLRKETPLIQIIDKPEYPLEKRKLGKIRAIIIGITIGGILAVFYLIISNFFNELLINTGADINKS